MVRLTALGLSVLGATPKSLGDKQTFIERIRDAIKSGGKEAIKSTIQALISYVISDGG